MFFVSAVRGFQVGRVGQLGEEADGARRVPDLGQSFLKIEKRSFKRAFSFYLLNFLVCVPSSSSFYVNHNRIPMTGRDSNSSHRIE